VRETGTLQKRASLHRIKVTNTADANFSLQFPGKSCTGMMDDIYGHRPDDGWVIGIEVSRRL
jgi:hypothetical protein